MQHRPMGKLVVEVHRPPMKFGHALVMGVKGYDGTTYVATAGEAGNLQWQPVAPGFEVPPLLYLDDDMVSQLSELFIAATPVKRDAQAEHLRDAIEIRDRLLEAVEFTVKGR